jgi:hypothetical protein
MDTSISKFIVDNSGDDDELDDLELNTYVDQEGNNVPECVPRSVEELDVGITPVRLADLSNLINLNKSKLISQKATEKYKYEITGADKTGTISTKSFVEELNKANDQLHNISDIILKEHIPTILLSGETNNNNK